MSQTQDYIQIVQAPITQESKTLLLVAFGVMAGLAVTFVTAYCCLRRKDKKKEAVWKD